MVSQRFRDDEWILRVEPQMKAIHAAMDQAAPRQTKTPGSH